VAKQTDAAGNVSAASGAITIEVDLTGPEVDYQGAYYDKDLGVLTLQGTGWETVGAVSEDVVAQLHAGGLSWDADNDGVDDYTFSDGDIDSAIILSDEALQVTLSATGKANLEAAVGVDLGAPSGSIGTPDLIDITVAFAGTDAAGNFGSGSDSDIPVLGSLNQGDMPLVYAWRPLDAGLSDDGLINDTLGEVAGDYVNNSDANFESFTVEGVSANQIQFDTSLGSDSYALTHFGVFEGGNVSDAASILFVDGAGALTNEFAFFEDGSKVIWNDGGSTTLSAGNKNDQLIAGASGDRLLGNAGNDLLIGGNGTDALYGGTGNDILFGGAGNDYLAGGSGADVFVYTQGATEADGHDVIRDFNAAVDKINVAGGDADALLAAAKQSGNDVVISLSGGAESIRLLGVVVHDLSLGNFTVDAVTLKGHALG